MNPYNMKPLTCLLTLAMAFSLAACNSSDPKRSLPQVVNLNQLTRTAFVPTLENRIENKKNIIYAPTLLYAWDEVEKAMKDVNAGKFGVLAD